MKKVSIISMVFGIALLLGVSSANAALAFEGSNQDNVILLAQGGGPGGGAGGGAGGGGGDCGAGGGSGDGTGFGPGQVTG